MVGQDIESIYKCSTTYMWFMDFWQRYMGKYQMGINTQFERCSTNHIGYNYAHILIETWATIEY